MPLGNSAISGIDVSSNQGQIDWKEVSKGDLSFAFIRATVGAHTADGLFPDNWKGTYGSGLLRGAYHFFWPLASAVDQAEKYVATVGALMPGDLPPAVDLEEAYLKENPQQDVWTTVPQNERLPMILGWLTRVENAFGRKPIIYSRNNFLEALLGEDARELAAYALWIAHYTQASQPHLPPAWHDWKFWQYTDASRVSGISGKVDGDRFNGTLDDMKTFVGG